MPTVGKSLEYVDFFDPICDTDRSPPVVEIYRQRFPELYQAIDSEKLLTADRRPIKLAGETLITYRSAIQRLYGKAFRYLDSDLQREILQILEQFSNTADKTIQYWDGATVLNNHQIGNLMPFPTGIPSINSLRADVVNIPRATHYEYYRALRREFFCDTNGEPPLKDRMYDYFDRFLSEVRAYYDQGSRFHPRSELQVAIYYHRAYFDFFSTFDGYVEGNLLQDFVDADLWGISNFAEYVRVANEIIDRRGRRLKQAT